MKASIEYINGRACLEQINGHLLRCDEVFMPRLSTRVDIGDYSRKIAVNAQRFEAWESDELVGLVAGYCNAANKDVAYITSVSVLQAWQGRGIASRLLENCIAHVRNLGFSDIELEVSSGNEAAVALYKKHGFSADLGKGGILRMSLNFEKGA
jgi:ribosomal protein S18 acetylase RimI-like enzyme